MNISFQLIELPENEQVVSRQISLPSSGGTIGRSYECTVQLPDMSRTLSRVHIEVLPHSEGGFQVIDRSANGAQVNGVFLGAGQSAKVSDGDSIRIGGYLLLVSDMQELFSKEAKPETSEPIHTPLDEPVFDFAGVIEEPAATVFGAESTAFNEIEEAIDTASSFSADNVAGEDVYAYDPFEEDDLLNITLDEKSSSEPIIMADEPSSHNRSSQSYSSQNMSSQETGVTLSNGSQIQALDSSIERLNQIVEHQQSALTAAVDRERLVSCIETTLDKFLADFNPQHLESEFNDYLSGWGSKEKKYWGLYKKQFARKQDRGEFKRNFTAMLLEELRDK
ncbi:signal peptide protein [Vibrio fortis]|uniref:Signal peptide protein n=1 Tax=Vibrio fortis TaxID=212667 RepID=A0A066UTM7_9VIBR|nr:FHA domain-containing protein [Vibrio fortis]KDN27489.1 signal peptide protein [Vibrio fortis]